MRRKNITNTIIRESITQALLLLMRTQPFAEIKITDIVRKAGVSRVSFYRNYDSKESVLISYLDEAAIAWWEQFSHTSKNIVQGVFSHCLDIGDTLRLLYDHQLYQLLWLNLSHLLGPAVDDPHATAYRKAELTGCVFGILIEWIGRGMKESPEEMSNIFDPVQINDLMRLAE